MKKHEPNLKEFEMLAHAYFEQGDRTYWDAIELAKQYFVTKKVETYLCGKCDGYNVPGHAVRCPKRARKAPCKPLGRE